MDAMQTGSEPQPNEALSDDCVQPFLIDRSGLHGRLVRMGPEIDAILSRHDYPDSVKALLGEFLALGAGLATALKYAGVFTLQTKGDGPVPMMVADVRPDGAVRGYAQVADAVPEAETVAEAPVRRLLGDGYMAFTVDQGQDMDRYQGIVRLDGDTLEDCVHHYFEQSEQLASVVKLAAGRTADGTWRAGYLSVQRMPPTGEEGAHSIEELEDDWRRALAMLATVGRDELLDPAIAPHRLLYRLFHEEGVRVFEPRALHDTCRCSRPRIADMLLAMGREETAEMKDETGRVEVTCQFCNRTERFTDGDLDAFQAEREAAAAVQDDDGPAA